jgi:hypothetical protein
MSVADYLGLDDLESPLMIEARASWRRWCADDDPDLAVVEDLADLPAWSRRAPWEVKDRVLGRLAQLAATDDAARAALARQLIPGAIKLAGELHDLSPDIDGLVAGQLWIVVASGPRVKRGVAKALLNTTRRAVLAELGLGRSGKGWNHVLLLDRFEDRAVQVEPESVDSYEELVEVLDSALRDNVVDASDIWLLHELAVAATVEDSPMRRGRCGLTSPALVDAIARTRPEAARTLRRRVGSAVDQLAAYVDCWQDDARLARWRDDHPDRLPTAKELAEEERFHDDLLTGRVRGSELEPAGTAEFPALVLRAPV